MNNSEDLNLPAEIIRQAQKRLCDENFVYVIPKFISKKAEGYFSMRIDISFLLESIEQLLQHQHNEIVRTSLWTSIISIHGKCFTDASNAGYPKLEINDLSDNYLEIHNHLMNLRHNFIAHRGITKFESSSLFMLIPKNDEISEKAKIRLLGLKQTFPNNDELILYKDYFLYLLELVNKKIQKSVEKANKGFFNLDPEIGKYFLINNLING
jgi:hypothetical protein